MDKKRFMDSCREIMNSAHNENGIGTLKEKTLHAVLKKYFEPHCDNHEIKLGRYVADIVCEDGIIEIQTRSFDKLRNKLARFLEVTRVTVVYPVARTKWVMWIDEATGETTNKRKSPKKGTPRDIFFELYKIKSLLTHENLRLCIVMLDVEEYRRLNGWSDNKKRGSTRYERIPTELVDEIYVDHICEYRKLMPDNLPPKFTAKDFKKAAGLTISRAQTALNVLNFVGAVERVGKSGNAYIYIAN